MRLVLLLKYSLLGYPGQQARHPLLSHPLLNPVDVLSRPLQVPVAVLSRQLPGPVPVPGRQHLPGRPHSRAHQLLLSRDPLLTCHLPSPVPLLSPSGLSHLLSRPKLPSLSGPSHLSTRPSLLVWEATGSLWWFFHFHQNWIIYIDLAVIRPFQWPFNPLSPTYSVRPRALDSQCSGNIATFRWISSNFV